MDKIIQTIVVRRKYPVDGGEKTIRTGKYCAQSAHASMAFLSNKWRNGKTVRSGVVSNSGYSVEEYFVPEPLTEEEQGWIDGSFTKICLYVDSEDELMKVYNDAIDSGLTSHLIKDSGLTEFGGEATYTALAIGPHWKSKIDPITKELKLF